MRLPAAHLTFRPARRLTAATAALAVLALMPLDALPAPLPIAEIMDVLHPLGGAVLAAWLTALGRARTAEALLLVGLVALAAAGALEVVQGLLERTPSYFDFLASAAGIGGYLLRRAWRLPRVETVGSPA